MSPFTSMVPGCVVIERLALPSPPRTHWRRLQKPPPKHKYDNLYALSKALMKRDPIKIEAELRQFIADAIAEKLLHDGIEVLIVSVDAKHVHVLARFPDHNPRWWIGWSKKYATQKLKAHGLAAGLDLKLGEGIWAKRSHPKPVEDRDHQLHTFGYILDHTKRGARVWRFDDASPAASTDRA